MAEPRLSSGPPTLLNRLRGYENLVVPIGFIGLLMVLLVPVPPMAMDVLIAGNIALAAIVLLTVIFLDKPLEFSGFPSLLLVTTMFRLVLNVATTRLILSADAPNAEAATAVAGKVVEQFAMFVAGSSIVVGVIIFAILVIVQFVVITKGATRISEVAARFTLDGMPGKQMAIDADLNAGLIDEREARNRREAISQEADFYGAMDGAAKFVRGDAIAGIIITIINILGGFAIGMAIKGWSFADSAEVFTKLTIGDGLVSQVPAFIVSLAAGLIVTRSSSKQDLGTELTEQLTSKSAALGLTSVLLGAMAVTPLPTLPLLLLAGVTGAIAWNTRDAAKAAAAEAVQRAERQQAPTKPPEPTPEEALQVDTLELVIGYGLVKLVDTTQDGDLLEKISTIRRQLAGEIGLVMPAVRIHDDMQLGKPNAYQLRVRGNTVAEGVVFPGQYLAMDSGLASAELPGFKTRDPAFGMPATWIEPGQRDRAEAMHYILADASTVLATHLTELIKTHAGELLTRQEVTNLLEALKERSPNLVEEVVGKDGPLRTGDLQKVLQNLLAERVPIRDLETILETLGDWASRTKDLDVLTEYVRNALRRTICAQYAVAEVAEDSLDGEATVHKLYCVSLDPQVEDMLNGYVDRSAEGTVVRVPPKVGNRLASAIARELTALVQAGHHPVLLTSPQVRGPVRQLVEAQQANVAVLGYNEVSRGVVVESLGLVSWDDDGQDARETAGAGQPAGA